MKKSTHSTNKADYSLDAFTRDLEQVVCSEGAKKVTLVGHSSGAIVAQDYAAKHPEDVDALVLIAASYDLRKTFVRNAVRRVLLSLSPLEGMAEIGYNRICRLFAGDRDRSEDYPDFTDDKFRKISDLGFAIEMAGRKDPAHLKATHALGQSVMEWNTEGTAPKIHAPTLLIHGGSDWLVPPKTAYELQEMIPGAKGIPPVIISNARHGVHFQQPEQVNAAMERFLVGDIYHGRLGHKL